MEHLGVDLNATGSVMTRAELEEQRRKRGNCLTCGRRCFKKKMFKMVPITDNGMVLSDGAFIANPWRSRMWTQSYQPLFQLPPMSRRNVSRIARGCLTPRAEGT